MGRRARVVRQLPALPRQPRSGLATRIGTPSIAVARHPNPLLQCHPSRVQPVALSACLESRFGVPPSGGFRATPPEGGTPNLTRPAWARLSKHPLSESKLRGLFFRKRYRTVQQFKWVIGAAHPFGSNALRPRLGYYPRPLCSVGQPSRRLEAMIRESSGNSRTHRYLCLYREISRTSLWKHPRMEV